MRKFVLNKIYAILLAVILISCAARTTFETLPYITKYEFYGAIRPCVGCDYHTQLHLINGELKIFELLEMSGIGRGFFGSFDIDGDTLILDVHYYYLGDVQLIYVPNKYPIDYFSRYDQYKLPYEAYASFEYTKNGKGVMSSEDILNYTDFPKAPKEAQTITDYTVLDTINGNIYGKRVTYINKKNMTIERSNELKKWRWKFLIKGDKLYEVDNLLSHNFPLKRVDLDYYDTPNKSNYSLNQK